MISEIVSELARRAADEFVATQRGQSAMTLEPTDRDEARGPFIQLFKESLKRQQAKFADKVHNETDERSVRLTALLDATFEVYKSLVPGMDVELKDINNRRNMAQNLSVEYLPILMLDPDELPQVFAEYILWKFGNTQATEQVVDIDYLKGAFAYGISLLPEKTRKATMSGKHRFEWGKLV